MSFGGPLKQGQPCRLLLAQLSSWRKVQSKCSKNWDTRFGPPKKDVASGSPSNPEQRARNPFKYTPQLSTLETQTNREVKLWHSSPFLPASAEGRLSIRTLLHRILRRSGQNARQMFAESQDVSPQLSPLSGLAFCEPFPTQRSRDHWALSRNGCYRETGTKWRAPRSQEDHSGPRAVNRLGRLWL